MTIARLTDLIPDALTYSQIDVGIGAGVESMTHHYGAGVLPEQISEDVLRNKEAEDCQLP